MEDRAIRFGVDPFRGQSMQIWQGTILGSGANGNECRKLVVSADCDLTDEKGNSDFFSLDIIRAEDFVRQLMLSDARSELVEVLLKCARETASSRAPSFANVSDDVMFEWLTESDEGRWDADLPGLHVNERDWLSAVRDSAVRILGGQSTGASNDASNASAVLLSCTNVQLTKQIEQVNKRMRNVLMSRLQPSRVDLYILPPLPGDLATAGHVVPFKSLALMAHQQVCLRRIELIKKPGGFIPIATCRPVLLQSLLQKMMTYFVRIGITNSFKSEQEAVVKTLVESLK